MYLLFFLRQTGDGFGNEGQLVAFLKAQKIDHGIHFACKNTTEVVGMMGVTCHVELAPQSLGNAEGAQHAVKVVASKSTGHHIQLDTHAYLFYLGKDVDQLVFGEQIQAFDMLLCADKTVAEVSKSRFVEGKIEREQIMHALFKTLFMCFSILGKILGRY